MDGQDAASKSFANWAKFALQATRRPVIARLFKYAVLLGLMLLTLRVVFDAYAFYVARRDIDLGLRSKKGLSLEYLNLATERQRALALTTLEARCLERAELTLFRIFDGQQDRIKAVYNTLMDRKNELIETIKKYGTGLVAVDRAAKYVDGAFFQLDELDEYLKPLNPEVEQSPEYKKLIDEVTASRRKYVTLALDNGSLRDDLERLIKSGKPNTSPYWNMDAIRVVVDRIDQLKPELEANKKELSDIGDIRDIMARYSVWTDALSGAPATDPVKQDIEFVIENAEARPLRVQDCARFKEYYAAANPHALFGIPSVYRDYLHRYFNSPPAAQTMYVTLLLGALGALTLNMLRMSRVGWWSKQDDPLWGEIIVSPFLGSLAAFSIFLIASAGLLLTADSNGSQPLSAYFIGLLGFLSGLLYDEAFGRVRRVGTQIFAARPEDATNARPEDRALAETLRNSGASLAAGLLLKYGIGTRLSLESEFTLLVPSDTAMGNIALATWTSLNDQTDVFEKWYHRHHSDKRFTTADVAADSAQLRVDDGTSYTATRDANGFKIDNMQVLIADVVWNKGVIQILGEQLS
jgi:fluoride ion exporter CrcB/FEX